MVVTREMRDTERAAGRLELSNRCYIDWEMTNGRFYGELYYRVDGEAEGQYVESCDEGAKTLEELENDLFHQLDVNEELHRSQYVESFCALMALAELAPRKTERMRRDAAQLEANRAELEEEARC